MAGALLAGSLLSSTSTLAAEAAAPTEEASSDYDEIVVTAKGRPEKLEDVSLSIVAVSADDLARHQVRDMRDLTAMVPGLVLEASRGRASASTLAIRGLAPNTINKQLQSVSVFLDGVFLGGSASMLDFPDIDGVEVLRGPQSTQFGRQTYAGAINYHLAERTPDRIQGRLNGFMSQNQGANDLNREIAGVIDMPILTDQLWLSLGGRWKTMGALASRVSPTRTVRIGEERTKLGSATLLFKPTDNFKLKLFGIYEEQRDSAPTFVTLQVDEWKAAGTPLTNLNTTANPVYWPIGTLGDVSPEMAGCESAAARPLLCGIDRDQYFISAVADWTFGAGYNLSLKAGYQNEKSWSNQDLYYRQGYDDPFFGNTPYSRRLSDTATSSSKAANPFFSATNDYYRVVSSELRLSSPRDRALRWSVGGYFLYESLTSYSQTNVTASNPTGRSRGDENARNFAIFGDIAYDFSPQLTLELEGRYDIESNIFEPCTICSTATTGGYKTYQQTVTNRRFIPRATLTFRPTEGSQVYALYSEGTKPGRWNQTIRTNFLYVEPEHNRNYEIGAKWRSPDGKLFFSGAGYYMDVTNQQFSAVSTALGVATTLFQNIGTSRIWGFELEGSYRPTKELTFRAGLAYADQQYTAAVQPDDANLTLLFQGSTFEGKTSIGLPRWTGSAGADYVKELGGGTTMRLGTNVSYTGKRFADSANLAQLAAVWRWNLSAGFDFRNNIGVTLFVRDLLDNNKASSAAVSATNSCLYMANSSGGTYSLAPEQRCLAVGMDRGREIGLSATFNF
ncbi:MAG: TonB-dependent receptor [Novosphingobium sp.]